MSSEILFASKVYKCSATGTEMDLAYTVAGDKTNPAVMLVTGLGANLEAYDSIFVDELVDKGKYFVIRIDNRDAGQSTKLDNAGGIKNKDLPPLWRTIFPQAVGRWRPVYSLNNMAEDVFALLDYLQVKKAHFVGVSMGGMIVQSAAIQQPERVLSLTSIMSVTGNKGVNAATLSTKLAAARCRPKSMALDDLVANQMNLCLGVLHRVPKEQIKEADQEFIRENAVKRMKHGPMKLPSYARQVMAIQSQPNRDGDLQKLEGKIPSLVIHGFYDELVPPQNGVHTAAQLTARKEGGVENTKMLLVPTMAHLMGPWCFGEVLPEILAVLKKGDGRL